MMQQKNTKHCIKILSNIHFAHHTLIIAMILMFTIVVISEIHGQIKSKQRDENTVEYYNIGNKKEKGNNYQQTNILKNPYDSLIVTIANKENIDPHLIRCIIKVESNFNKDAVSVAGAMGLMQLMQDIAQAYNVDDPFNPEQNIKAGVKHFKSLLALLDNDIVLALAAYHAGIGRVKKNMTVPNISSTIEYVNAVMKLYKPQENNNYTTKIEKLYLQILPDGTINITTIK